MRNLKDFVIENGMLKEYKGKSGDSENRGVNGTIFELDRLSVKSFIRQDKVEKLTENMLNLFIMAQTSEFIL